MPATIQISDLQPFHQLIDVRTPSEFASGHIAGALNVPLDRLESQVEDLAPDGGLVLVCKAGTRARLAAELLQPCRPHALVLDGGMDAWYRAGRPVVVTTKTRWSLERQVRFVAGLLVLTGIVLSFVADSRWVFLSGFIGLGLTFAGLTDLCPMGMFLASMPWNRHSKLRANRDNVSQSCSVAD